MNSVRIVIDMNLSPQWVSVLQEAGWEAIHWSDIGAPSAPDRAILKWAAENEAAIFTHDLDFGTLLASMHRDQPSVIQVRAQDVMPRALKSAVLGALDQVAAHLAEGALVTVEPHRVRIRILPL